MKKQVLAMEATGHCNILKTYDHFDEEDDGTFYVVSFIQALIFLFIGCRSRACRSWSWQAAANYSITVLMSTAMDPCPKRDFSLPLAKCCADSLTRIFVASCTSISKWRTSF